MTRLALLLLIVALVLVAWIIVGFYETPPAEPVRTTTTEAPATWPPPRSATTTTTTVATTTTMTARARTAPTVTASVWDRIAACESGGRWNDTRRGYEGGVHFLHSTWVAAGGRRYAEHAYQATRAQQIAIADAWRRHTSWDQWPLCSRRLGLR